MLKIYLTNVATIQSMVTHNKKAEKAYYVPEEVECILHSHFFTLLLNTFHSAAASIVILIAEVIRRFEAI